ncbi:MAG: Cys-tRNA(Pro) deacylase [Clostridia bacterium]|nr:Cys-tRNA(Pro) deacylase [Clostridia bacterium]
MSKKQDKTNVMRILDQKKVEYNAYFYDTEEAVSGTVVASMIGKDPSCVFKTLVTVGASKQNYVFVVPVEMELDLKKGAKAVGEKNISMIKAKELLPLTGYVHGGCSPIGMKKFFTTAIDISALDHEKIIFSAGKIGYQVEVSISDLGKVIKFSLQDLV